MTKNMRHAANRSAAFACALLMCPFTLDWGSWKAKPGVTVDSGLIAKRDVFVPRAPGAILGIDSVAKGNSVASGIAVMGREEVVFLSPRDYRPVRTCRFDETAVGREKLGSNPHLIPVSADSFEIMRGGGGFSKIGLMDARGNLLWTFNPRERGVPHKMIVADLDSDGVSHFYVADHTGLYELDHAGKILRRFSEDPTDDIGVIQHGGDGRQLLVASNSRHGDYRIQVYDSEGRIVKDFVPEYKRWRFDVIDWPDRPHLLMGYRCRNVLLLDLDGKIAFQHELRGFPLFHGPQGAVVKFKKAGRPYLVVSARSRAATRWSQLSVFSPEGELVFQEILDDWIKLCVNRDKSDDEEVLLVGVRNRICEYSLRPSEPSNRRARQPNAPSSICYIRNIGPS